MNHALSCADARMLFALLLYGELSFDEEERVDAHLDGCADCGIALEREKSLHAAFDGVAVEPAASLLRECRAELGAAIHLEHSRGLEQSRGLGQSREQLTPPARASRYREASPTGWWGQVVNLLGTPVLRFAGAAALIALGFLGARLTPLLSEKLGESLLTGASQAGIARVSDVETQADGSVRIVVDETRQRTISGNLDDQKIRTLLLDAARDPSNPGLRADSVSLLSRRAQSAEIRGALVYLVGHDPNDGVRLNAMEGLKNFAADPEVRGALSRVLLSDANPGVRTQAIDLLIPGPDDHSLPNVDSAMIGTLQELMLHENNAGVRQRIQRVLEAINASAEIY
jgi:hypothetical protein